MNHSDRVFLPFRAESKELRSTIEFDVCNACSQVHYRFRRLLIVSQNTAFVEVENIYCAHFATRCDVLSIWGHVHAGRVEIAAICNLLNAFFRSPNIPLVNVALVSGCEKVEAISAECGAINRAIHFDLEYLLFGFLR